MGCVCGDVTADLGRKGERLRAQRSPPEEALAALHHPALQQEVAGDERMNMACLSLSLHPTPVHRAQQATGSSRPEEHVLLAVFSSKREA